MFLPVQASMPPPPGPPGPCAPIATPLPFPTMVLKWWGFFFVYKMHRSQNQYMVLMANAKPKVHLAQYSVSSSGRPEAARTSVLSCNIESTELLPEQKTLNTVTVLPSGGEALCHDSPLGSRAGA